MLTPEQNAVIQSLLGPSVMKNIQANPAVAALLGGLIPQPVQPVIEAQPTPSTEPALPDSDRLILKLFKEFLAEEENAHMAAGWAKFARYVQSEVGKLKQS